MSKFDSLGSDYHMTVNGLSVGLNTPKALQSHATGHLESVHGLPPYHRRRAFLVDEYPACPESWMRSSGRTKSYFVAIIEGGGLWLDLNACLASANHVAAVISIQGINAITGLPCKDPQLEQYRDQCPKHKDTFGPDRLCRKCGFKWPKQNYLATTGTPFGSFWLDGFRAEDGSVRQYMFTASEIRGIAANIIGKDRVFALGVSFFKSKEPKPAPPPTRNRGLMSFSDGLGTPDMETLDFMGGSKGSSGGDLGENSVHNYYTASAGMSLYCASSPVMKSCADPGITSKVADFDEDRAHYERDMLMSRRAASAPKVKLTKNLEIAAGARINQTIYDDPNGLEFWQTEPDGIIVINYCTEEDAEKIFAAGKVDLSGHQDGFMATIPVGNPGVEKALP